MKKTSDELIEQLRTDSKLKAAWRRHRATQDLRSFICYRHQKYKPQWYHDLICKKCDEILTSGDRNLMVFLPPRHGKTEIISRHLPAYILGRWPDSSIIATSYGADLASRNNRDVQRIIDGSRFRTVFPGTQLSGRNIRTVAHGHYLRNNEIFEIVNHAGVYRSSGVGGGITGMGFNRLGIIDDPVKNREEGESKTIQRKIREWYDSTFLTRRESGACVILIMTRWHRHDLAGQLLDEEPDSWEVMRFPAIMTLDYPYRHPEDRRKTGEALWPDRYSLEFLQQFQRNKYEWNALFQQIPYTKGGNLINREWFLYAEKAPDPALSDTLRFWDLASSVVTGDNDPDYTVGALVRYREGNYYVIDVVAERKSPAETEALIRRTSERDDRQFNGKLRQVWEEEGGASGKFMSAYFNRALKRHLRQPYRVTKSKEHYIERLANKAETGNIYLCAGPWLHEKKSGSSFLDECEDFPRGLHDDRVDAVAKAVYLLSERNKDDIDYLDPIYTPSTVAAEYDTEHQLF